VLEGPCKVVIVEGLSDKKQIEKIISEDVEVICTNGTIGIAKLDELLYDYDLDYRDVFIMVDEDKAGNRLRKLLARELPHAQHIHISSEFREVAAAPHYAVATALAAKRIAVDPLYLL